MPMFHYKGRKRDQQWIEGECESLSLDAAIDQLHEQGITLVDIRALAEKKSLASLLTLRLDRSVRLPELIIFARQMYTLTKAGVPLAPAIKQLAEAARNPLLAKALYGIERGLLAGQSLGTGFGRYTQIFPPIFVELVLVGEESGCLEEAFQHIGSYLLLEYTTARQFKEAIRYPLIVIIAVLGAMLVMNFFVIPNFTRLYSSFHTQLPLVTKWLIAFSAFLQAYGIYLAIGLLALGIVITSYLRSTAGKLLWSRVQLHLPILGPILERIMISRFTRTLGIIFRAGIPLNRGMTLLSNAVGNAHVRQCVLAMRYRIENGESLSQAAAGTHLFSPMVLQMMRVGEETGMMDTLLQEVAEFYEREINYDLENLGDKIEPVLLLLIGGMVLFLAVAVFLPMWDIYKFAKS